MFHSHYYPRFTRLKSTPSPPLFLTPSSMCPIWGGHITRVGIMHFDHHVDILAFVMATLLVSGSCTSTITFTSSLTSYLLPVAARPSLSPLLVPPATIHHTSPPPFASARLALRHTHNLSCQHQRHQSHQRYPAGDVCPSSTPTTSGLSRGHPQFHGASSEQAHHPLQLASSFLWPRHTRLNHPMHQLPRHVLIGTAHRVRGTRFRAVLAPRLPAASSYSVCMCGAAKSGVRAHGEGEGEHRGQAVAAPDTCALQKVQRDNREYSRVLLVAVPESLSTSPGVNSTVRCHCR